LVGIYPEDFLFAKLFRNNSSCATAHERPRFNLLLFPSRNTILEDGRVSAFKNFFMSPSAESFSRFVFDTVQSDGTNKSKSRM
jgi:hypothetical protein